MQVSIEDVVQRYRNERNSWDSEQFRTRVHRAISWLRRASEEHDDPDASFIFLWISFNAAYARMIEDSQLKGEREKYDRFIGCLVSSDRRQRIANLLFNQFSDSLEELIKNQYVFHDYWQRQLYPDKGIDWEQELSLSIVEANAIARKRKAYEYLRIVLSRVHVLRNQIIHGASTFGSKTNRKQVQDAADVLRQLVPLMIDVMMDNPVEEEWGDILYPVQ
ncbi:MAG: hypothetical protein FGM32_11160 [Candidatus Kapabacteria bacterium]|nr:hypothetical protein [Candidatus Kapabacteria bacterium]